MTESLPHSVQDLAPLRFSKAAGNYDSHARVQKQVSQHLWEWVNQLLPDGYQPAATLDIGSGTGFMTELLLRNYPECPTHAVDIAPGMVEWLRERSHSNRLKVHLMDGEHLSVEKLWVPPHSLLISSMCAQWFVDLEQALRRWVSVSNNIALSVLLDGSFEAWHQAHEETGQAVGLQALPIGDQVQDILHGLKAEGLVQHAAFKTREFLDHHPDGLSFARSLRAIGADTPKSNHQPVNLRRVIRELGMGCTMNYKVGFIYLSRQ